MAENHSCSSSSSSESACGCTCDGHVCTLHTNMLKNPFICSGDSGESDESLEKSNAVDLLLALRGKQSAASIGDEPGKDAVKDISQSLVEFRKSPLRRTQSTMTSKEVNTELVTTRRNVVQIAVWADPIDPDGKDRMLAALRRHRNVFVTGVCVCCFADAAATTVNLRRHNRAEKVNVPSYPNEKTMLRDSRVDAIVVATDTTERTRCIRRSIDAGKHVFVTGTPLASTIEQWQEFSTVLALATKRRLIVSAMQPHRLDAAFEILKKRIVHETRQFGQPVSIQHDFSYPKPPQNWKTERPLLIDEGARIVDTTHFLMGLPTSQLNFVTDNSHERFQAFVENRYANGKTFSTFVVGSRSLATPVAHETVTVRFSRGSVRLDLKTQSLWVFDHEHDSIVQMRAKSSSQDEIWQKAAQNFVDAVLNNGKSYITHDELLYSTRFSLIVELNKEKLV